MQYFPHFSSSFLLFFLHNIKPAAAATAGLSDGAARPMLFWKWPAPCCWRHDTHPFPVPSSFPSLSLSHACLHTHTRTRRRAAASIDVVLTRLGSPPSLLSLPLRPKEEAHSCTHTVLSAIVTCNFGRKISFFDRVLNFLSSFRLKGVLQI